MSTNESIQNENNVNASKLPMYLPNYGEARSFTVPNLHTTPKRSRRAPSAEHLDNMGGADNGDTYAGVPLLLQNLGLARNEFNSFPVGISPMKNYSHRILHQVPSRLDQIEEINNENSTTYGDSSNPGSVFDELKPQGAASAHHHATPTKTQYTRAHKAVSGDQSNRQDGSPTQEENRVVRMETFRSNSTEPDDKTDERAKSPTSISAVLNDHVDLNREDHCDQCYPVHVLPRAQTPRIDVGAVQSPGLYRQCHGAVPNGFPGWSTMPQNSVGAPVPLPQYPHAISQQHSGQNGHAHINPQAPNSYANISQMQQWPQWSQFGHERQPNHTCSTESVPVRSTPNSNSQDPNQRNSSHRNSGISCRSTPAHSQEAAREITTSQQQLSRMQSAPAASQKEKRQSPRRATPLQTPLEMQVTSYNSSQSVSPHRQFNPSYSEQSTFI